MVYGEDPLWLVYAYVPSITAIIQSGNLYAYAIQNPTRWVDPYGKAVTQWDLEHLTDSEIALLQYYTDNWNYVLKTTQDAWRAAGELIRNKSPV